MKTLICSAITLSLATATFAQNSPPPRPEGGKGGKVELNEQVVRSTGATQVTAEVWVDNWFALWINGEKLTEDSVAYETERSFNADKITFNADLPMTIAFEFRDFMEDATGLEYIGTGKQQMGDGGAIAQFSDAAGNVLAVTDTSWRCMVAQHAPINSSCARESSPTVGAGACAANDTAAPAHWTAPGFDDSGWAAAEIHSEGDVGPKDGYNQVTWHKDARLIWGPNLKQDNIVLCRATVN